MEQSLLDKYADLIPLIEQIAAQVVAQKADNSQYEGFNTTDHSHDGVNTNQLGPEAISTVQTLSAVGDGNPNHAGVVNPALLGNQTVSQGSMAAGYGNLVSYSNQNKHATFVTLPIPVITGAGVGTDSEFNGGKAPIGTLVFFNNGSTIAGLWVNIDGQTWMGTAGSTFTRTA